MLESGLRREGNFSLAKTELQECRTFYIFTNFVNIKIYYAMNAITIHPKNKKQEVAIKQILKALEIPFKKTESPYNPEFVEKIKESEQQIKEGKVTRLTKENQKAFLGL
ncbi:MAG TPA: DUF2683 family protein [Flavobacterium sp.]|nr:DUF2683 family protein [Flavobacterium sp.]